MGKKIQLSKNHHKIIIHQELTEALLKTVNVALKLTNVESYILASLVPIIISRKQSRNEK